MSDHPSPTIHCTPPTDAAFLAAVVAAFDQARGLLTGEMAVLVGTMVRIRTAYPCASIIAVAQSAASDESSPVWLVSRDGWRELAAPVPTAAGAEHAERVLLS